MRFFLREKHFCPAVVQNPRAAVLFEHRKSPRSRVRPRGLWQFRLIAKSPFSFNYPSAVLLENFDPDAHLVPDSGQITASGLDEVLTPAAQ